MGLFKSAIYFPFAVLNQLNMQEMEAIIAHELAHIKRNDFLLNLIAAAIETMLYYHPVIWWLQSNFHNTGKKPVMMRALAFTRNPMAYARALLKIEEMEEKNSTPELSLVLPEKQQSITQQN